MSNPTELMKGYVVSEAWKKFWEKTHNAPTTLKKDTVLPRNNTMKYCTTRTDVVRFVKHQLENLAKGSQLTITIEREKSGGFYVSDATNSLSVGTLMPSYSNGPQSTSK